MKATNRMQKHRKKLKENKENYETHLLKERNKKRRDAKKLGKSSSTLHEIAMNIWRKRDQEPLKFSTSPMRTLKNINHCWKYDGKALNRSEIYMESTIFKSHMNRQIASKVVVLFLPKWKKSAWRSYVKTLVCVILTSIRIQKEKI